MNAYEYDEQIAMLKGIAQQANETASSLQRVFELLTKIHNINSQPQPKQPKRKRKDQK